MSRLTGKALTLTISGTDYAPEIMEYELSHEPIEGDGLTFGDLASGEIDKGKLSITAKQSTDPSSLWMLIWQHAGETVTVTLSPHGNATPTPSEPHFTGSAVIGPRPKIGGKAGGKTEYDYQVEWEAEINKTPVIA